MDAWVVVGGRRTVFRLMTIVEDGKEADWIGLVQSSRIYLLSHLVCEVGMELVVVV